VVISLVSALTVSLVTLINSLIKKDNEKEKYIMNEKTKKIIKISGIIALALGTVGVYAGGGSEGYIIEIVSSVVGIIGVITLLIKGA
jgi:hypothetical protein